METPILTGLLPHISSSKWGCKIGQYPTKSIEVVLYADVGDRDRIVFARMLVPREAAVELACHIVDTHNASLGIVCEPADPGNVDDYGKAR